MLKSKKQKNKKKEKKEIPLHMGFLMYAEGRLHDTCA